MVMETRLSRICDAIIEAGWLAALIVTPLFFNTYSSRVFEPDKLHLLRSIALLMAVAWCVQLLDQLGRHDEGPRVGLWERIRTTPLVLPTLVLVLAYLLSTLLSVLPRVSFLGSYVRLQGTFTFVSYVAIFFMVLTHLRTRAQLNRLFYAIILTSVPIALYGLIQRMGLDPLPWGGDVQDRVAANMGNAIFVAAYLIMAFFLTVERLVDSVAGVLTEDHPSDLLRVGGYVLIIGLQLITIESTQSRGPELGLLAGAYIFCMLGLRLLGRWGESNQRAPDWMRSLVVGLNVALIIVTIAGLAFMIVLNTPGSPLASLRKERAFGRMSTVFSLTEGTNAVRVLIWEGVVDLMFKPHAPLQYPDGHIDVLNPVRPLIGYGPESMWVAYNPFYPPNLAHYEARNASPDRSHNETFDALVRTGFLGLLAQLVLYGSLFYYALSWLGLVRSRSRQMLFLGLLVGGALLGILVPWIFDHSLRLVGLGLPTGMIVGLIIYVTVDMFQRLPASQAAPAQLVGQVSGRRQLLIVAIFAAIVAHFAEIHFGIAIASTLTHFWVLAGVLIVVGMGWLREDAEPVPAPENERRMTAPAVQAAGSGKAARSKRAEASRAQAGRGVRDRRPVMTERSVAATQPGSIRAFLPYVLIGAIITMVLVWDFAINQTGVQGALNILWQSFAARIDPATHQPVGSPALLILVLVTWLLGGVIGLAELYRTWRPGNGGFRWSVNALIYAAVMLAVFFVYGTWQTSLTQIGGIQGLEVFQHIASYLDLFDSLLLVAGVILAAAVFFADRRYAPARWFGASPVLSMASAAVLAGLAFLIISRANVQIVQADIFYKQAQAYEDAGAWDGAIVLYDQAARMEPSEDFYYLFLGRALLEYSSQAQPGNASLPVKLSGVATSDLLPLAEQTLFAPDGALKAGLSRDELIRASHVILEGAQRLNPLNTDHTANLARLFRTWALAQAVAPNQSPDNQTLRRLVKTDPGQIDMSLLNESLSQYEHATALSPHNAQLWNEQASVRYIMGDTQGALADVNRSLELDNQYYQTYLLKGDVLAEAGDKLGALAAYKQVAAMRPNDGAVQSAIGVYSAQLGDTQAALDAFKRVIGMESAAAASVQKQLDALHVQGQDSDAQRQALQGTLDAHKGQLYATYRNQALVLRDAKRYDEAIAAAQLALSNATPGDQAAVQQLIRDLQKQQPG
jgi:tetratricopeptide (TPR) repeat protein